MYQLKRLVGAGPSYAPVPQSNGTDPLLPSFSAKEDEDDDDVPTFTAPSRDSLGPRTICRRLLLPLLVVVGLFIVLAIIAFFMGAPTSTTPPKAPSEPETNHPATGTTPETDAELAKDPTTAARILLDALFNRQSQTLAQAEARYSLKTDRPPPPHFDRWFTFAHENKCLIDDYDQIHHDLETTQAHAVDQMLKDSKGMTTINIKNNRVHVPDYRGTSFYDDWKMIIGNIVLLLPDMDFLLNGRDEPRVDPNPFHIAPKPTSEFFQDQSGCSPFSSPLGFATDASADIAFLRSSSSSDFTTDLWPLLSMTKITPCFSDILFPGPYDYAQSWWSGSFDYPNDVEWKDKKPQIYWRGMSNGGHIIGQNYHKFPRFRTRCPCAQPHGPHRRQDDALCRDALARRTVTATTSSRNTSPKEEIYKYKYLLDVDGNTFSGRFLGLLKSGSLVFKYFNDWLRPYEHFIPVLPDLSDLLEKIHWAMENEGRGAFDSREGEAVHGAQS
ncbi:hypothetical protein B0H16DRAFT_1784695 [Mycena metata]|uniref:Glycosyl transferase CAP10 domain-containing protein n=1 Tax=Mycena metata TaxID=1033252 RepID=A0AAD7KFS4_9AGAR|nr:hypothetical protein B0H16DRAFT_1784695 [Mycena metata]